MMGRWLRWRGGSSSNLSEVRTKFSQLGRSVRVEGMCMELISMVST